MNRYLKTSFALVLLVLCQAVVAEEKKSFWNKYKGAIIAGTAAVAAAGVAVAVGATVGSKTKNALDAAGIKSGNSIYADAIACVAFLGPLGSDKTDSLIEFARKNKFISEERACIVLTGKIRNALNHFWGKGIVSSGWSKIKGLANCAGGDDWDELKGAVQDLKGAAKKFFN